VFLDMLVHARPTALLAAAVRAGHRDCLDGLAMLLPQAALQVERLGLKLLSAPYSASLLTGESWLRRRDAPIVLVGLRCAGKTTVGERVAAMLGRTFLDTDREVERRAGRSVEDLLQAGQERHFRALEADVLLYAVEAPGTVVACGGGAALHAAPFAELAAWGWVVLLDAPDDVLLARRAASPRTPLTSLTPAEELARQRAERMPVYRRAARLTLDVATLDAEAAAASIAAAWDALPPEVWSARPEARP
jgi:shikimate kinase